MIFFILIVLLIIVTYTAGFYGGKNYAYKETLQKIEEIEARYE